MSDEAQTWTMRRRGTIENFWSTIVHRMLGRYERPGSNPYVMGPSGHRDPRPRPFWRVAWEGPVIAGLRVCDLPGDVILIELESTPAASLDPLTGFWTWLVGELDALGFAEMGKGAPASEDPIETGEEPWNQIPDHRWHRDAVRWWCQGLEGQQIANQIEQITSGKTVLNRISKLRTEYPEAGIPYNEDR